MSHHSQIEEHEFTFTGDFHYPLKDKANLCNTTFYMHSIYEHVFNGNVGAPVHEKLQNGGQILVIGVESGIWVTEVASEYPDTQIYAIDASVPSSDSCENVTFIEWSVFKKLPFPDSEFDYVFSRDKYSIFAKNDFQENLSEIFRVLKPGGYSWLMNHNIDHNLMVTFENVLQESGKAESISRNIVNIPIRSDNSFGEFSLDVYLFYFRSAKDYMAPFMDISFEEFDTLMNNVESELNAKNSSVVLRHKQVFARKKNTHSKETEIKSIVSSDK
ncbi:15967_t:CDS:2 [Cetraspora pellucida]|uniref:15967_t:CDS:1 n=1 Tax=Cetraspora pellucida TaxID=1433469 RepID=A0A9N9AYN9_9GLOM|nr:15967_t:CDS:2 [Cetraspora pellucida]